MPIPFKFHERSPDAWQGTLYIMCFAQMVSMIGPLLGVGIAAWIGPRMVFGTAALLYLTAALLAAWGLPHSRCASRE